MFNLWRYPSKWTNPCIQSLSNLTLIFSLLFDWTIILSKFKIKDSVFIADFNWDLIIDIIQKNKIIYSPVNKYPKVRRDLSLLIDNNISFDKLKKIAKKIDNSLLKEINLFDVFSGDKLPKNKKSYALSFIFEDNSKTLTDFQIDKIMGKLISEFENSVGAEIR